MNWRRGIIRAWVVGSLLWVMLATAANWSGIAPTIRPEEISFDDLIPRRPSAPDRVLTDEEMLAPKPSYKPPTQRRNLRPIVGMILGPPAFAGVMLIGAAWVIAGFRRP